MRFMRLCFFVAEMFYLRVLVVLGWLAGWLVGWLGGWLALRLGAWLPGPWLQDRAKGQASALTRVEKKGVKNQEQSRSSKVGLRLCRGERSCAAAAVFGDAERGSELCFLLSAQFCTLLCPWAPPEGATTRH